jgi:hypothetical protein
VLDRLRPGNLSRNVHDLRDSADNYILVLVLLVLGIVATGFHSGDITAVWGQGALFLLATVVALHSSRVPRAVYLGVALLAVVWSAVVLTTGSLGPLSSLSVALLAITAPVAIIRRISTHRRVTVRTIAGAVSVYLWIGIVFASLYRAMELVAPGSIETGGVPIGFSFIYLSFITLTTIGYGDVLPGSDPMRMVAMLEGLFGQVYLVVVVARLVALFGQDRELSDRERAIVEAQIASGVVDEEVMPEPDG